MAKDPREKGVDEREKAKQDSVDEYYAREAEAQPTPTQKENDLAKVGVDVAKKEDDGSEKEVDAQRRVMEAKLDNPYATRVVEPAKSSDHKSSDHKASDFKK